MSEGRIQTRELAGHRMSATKGSQGTLDQLSASMKPIRRRPDRRALVDRRWSPAPWPHFATAGLDRGKAQDGMKHDALQVIA